MIDSAKYANIVLPAASFLESDDLVGSYFHLSLGPQSKAADPMGDALPNQEIFRRLAKAMNLAEPALFEADADILSHLLEAHDINFRNPVGEGMFLSLRRTGDSMGGSRLPDTVWQDRTCQQHRRARRPFAYTITGTIGAPHRETLEVTDAGR